MKCKEGYWEKIPTQKGILRVNWEKNIKSITIIRYNNDKTFTREEIMTNKFML
jgi:hypothetical protein